MAGLGAVGWIIYAVVIIAMFYFLGVRPQQQEKKKLQDLMSSLAVGDTVLRDFTVSSLTLPRIR